eukprot:scaffold7066_cov253-Pinguiococcus_pyrenoidosus.AAC.15
MLQEDAAQRIAPKRFRGCQRKRTTEGVGVSRPQPDQGVSRRLSKDVAVRVRMNGLMASAHGSYRLAKERRQARLAGAEDVHSGDDGPVVQDLQKLGALRIEAVDLGQVLDGQVPVRRLEQVVEVPLLGELGHVVPVLSVPAAGADQVVILHLMIRPGKRDGRGLPRAGASGLRRLSIPSRHLGKPLRFFKGVATRELVPIHADADAGTRVIGGIVLCAGDLQRHLGEQAIS